MIVIQVSKRQCTCLTMQSDAINSSEMADSNSLMIGQTFLNIIVPFLLFIVQYLRLPGMRSGSLPG